MTPMNRHKGTPDQVRAVVYVRQSKKREDDSRTSPEAQRTKCEALVRAKGWHHSGTFADVGISGWDPDVTRPEFDDLMTAVRAGEVDAVVIFSLSRLTRRGALEAMRIHEELAAHGVLLVSVEEPYLDTSTPMGVAIFGLIAALAQQESDLKSAYVTATKDTLRKAGSHVSGMAPYGMASERVVRGPLTVVRLIPEPEEARQVRRMVAWALEGVSASAIATRLTAEGVPTRTTRMGAKARARADARLARQDSKPLERIAWYSTTVLTILRDPRMAGYAITGRGRDAEILYADGAPVASHEPVIQPEEWWRLQDVLKGRSTTPRRTLRSRPTLLTGMGILVCDVCQNVMVGDTRNGRGLYKCNRPPRAVEGHGGLAIYREPVDGIVTRAVWSRLSALEPEDPEDLELLAEASRRFAAQQDTGERQAELAAARAELDHVRAALRTLYQDRQDGLYEGNTGREMFRDSVERLTTSETRVAARVTDLETSAVDAVAIPTEWTEPGMDPIGPGSTWDGWDLDERRAFIRLFVDKVRVTRSVGRGRHANTADRVVIRWAGEGA